MDETELEFFRLKMRLEVQLVLLRGLYSGWANFSPSVAQGLRDQFATLREEHGKIVFRGLKEGYSDLAAAEYQEALDDALSFIEDGFNA